VTVKYTFINGEEGCYPVSSMCRWATVSRSGYYEWRDRGPSATTVRRRDLEVLIRWSFDRSDGTYGYRRVHADLARRGEHADPDTIRQVMRDLDLIACQPRPWRPVTTIAGATATTPDLLGRDFTATAPATKLVGDIPTCAPGKGGCTRPASWTATPNRSSGTPWPITSAPASSPTPYRWPPTGSPSPPG